MFLRTFQSIAAFKQFSTAGGSAFDKQVSFQRWQTDHALERRYKLSVAIRINIRVCDLNFRRAQKIASDVGFIEVRMVKPDRHGAEKTVEVNQSAIIDCIV